MASQLLNRVEYYEAQIKELNEQFKINIDKLKQALQLLKYHDEHWQPQQNIQLQKEALRLYLFIDHFSKLTGIDIAPLYIKGIQLEAPKNYDIKRTCHIYKQIRFVEYVKQMQKSDLFLKDLKFYQDNVLTRGEILGFEDTGFKIETVKKNNEDLRYLLSLDIDRKQNIVTTYENFKECLKQVLQRIVDIRIMQQLKFGNNNEGYSMRLKEAMLELSRLN